MQLRAEDTHRRILEAGAECFARQGYEATGVAELCRRAGVTKGAFYHHFPSKQALFLEMLERWLGSLDAQLEVALAEATSIPDGLHRMMGKAAQVFRVAGGQVPLFLEFWDQASHDPAVWKASIAPYRRYRRFLADLIEKGIAEGSLRPIDPETGAHLLLSTAVGLLLQGLLDPEGVDWARVAQDCLGILMMGVQREVPAAAPEG